MEKKENKKSNKFLSIILGIILMILGFLLAYQAESGAGSFFFLDFTFFLVIGAVALIGAGTALLAYSFRLKKEIPLTESTIRSIKIRIKLFGVGYFLIGVNFLYYAINAESTLGITPFVYYGLFPMILAFFFIVGVLSIISSIGLFLTKNWGRKMAIVLAGIMIFPLFLASMEHTTKSLLILVICVLTVIFLGINKKIKELFKPNTPLKLKNKILMIFVIIFVVFFGIFGSLYSISVYTSNETKNAISSTFEAITDLAIYENKIVWVGTLNISTNSWGIYMYDLDTGKEEKVSIDGRNLEIYKNFIVYSNNYDIYVYDLDTKKETQITKDSFKQIKPRIYKNKVVWADERNKNPSVRFGGNYDIYMYDLDTGKEVQITKDPSYQDYPDIYENKIVWTDRRNGESDIYMYDLDTGKESFVAGDSELAEFGPRIYGNKIIFQKIYVDETKSRNKDILMYDLISRNITRLTFDETDQNTPKISGNFVIWRSYGEKTSIWLHNLENEKTKELPLTNYDHTDPSDIYGNKIVWVGTIRYKEERVYFLEVEEDSD